MRSNLHSKKLDFNKDTIVLDSFPILQKTLQVFDNQGNKLDSSFFYLKNKQLIFTQKINQFRRDSLGNIGFAQYRVLPFRFDAAVAHKDTAWFLGGQRDPKDWFAYTAQRDASRSVLESRGLDYSGSLTRGISVGSAQDLVVNSQFNLQLPRV